MIHTTLAGPRRRIAVLEIPRDAAHRLGTIRPADVSILGLDSYSGVYPTVTNDQAPSNAAQLLASALAAQAAARETTPGTLIYTPAPPSGPAPNVAPWNSWAGPCATGTATGSTAAGSSAAAPPARSAWYAIAAVIGAAASVAYLTERARKKK